MSNFETVNVGESWVITRGIIDVSEPYEIKILSKLEKTIKIERKTGFYFKGGYWRSKEDFNSTYHLIEKIPTATSSSSYTNPNISTTTF